MRRDSRHISVCICTYKRPDLLLRLLSELSKQQAHDFFTYSIVVVDNDNLRSAENVVTEFAAHSSVRVKYLVQPIQGIALTRNRAVENATGDYVAMIDDDEFPVPEWLYQLVTTCEQYNVDGVLGPVRRHFDEKPPNWILKTNLYRRPEYPTGYRLTWRQGRSGNLLAKRELFSLDSPPFNPDFRTGEDQDFLRRMEERGRSFIWCNEAVAYEAVPPIRWNRTFLLKRALLRGAMEPKMATFGVRDVVKSLIAIPIYLVALPFAFLLGQHRFVPLSIRFCDHLGKILALVGIQLVHDEYVTE
jgi:succinoglycan biosynthesis protein ExoM